MHVYIYTCRCFMCMCICVCVHIERNAGLEEAQAGIKNAGRNTNNLRYADDTTLRQKVKRS